MKATPTPRQPSRENSPDPAVGRVPASKVPPMTAEEWAASQPYRPLPRVPLMAAAHFYKDCLGRPPSRIIEPARKSAKINWVLAFQEAKAARDAAAAAAAAAAADEAEGS